MTVIVISSDEPSGIKTALKDIIVEIDHTDNSCAELDQVSYDYQTGLEHVLGNDSGCYVAQIVRFDDNGKITGSDD